MLIAENRLSEIDYGIILPRECPTLKDVFIKPRGNQMKKSKSHLGQVIDALRILDGVDEPLDSTTLAELIGLTPEQVGASLSILHRTGYMKCVGRTATRHALYLQCKPIRATPAEIRRAYKNMLKQEDLDYKAIQREVASKIARVTIRAIERELKKQIIPDNKIQLTLPL